MDILCIIPARGGSQRIPRKNLLSIAGMPLLSYSIYHGLNARQVTEVIVSTDDEEIEKLAKSMGVSVVLRPEELSVCTATSESALLHVLDKRISEGKSDPDLIVFLQCTSPVRKSDDIDNAITTFLENNLDSLFSACDNKRLIWCQHKNIMRSLTYDYKQRKREQDMEKQYYENGSLYVIKPEHLRKFNNRMSGKVGVYEMDMLTSFQLDSYEDIELIEWILNKQQFKPIVSWPEKIDLLVFDFDGVMTTNLVHVNKDGEEFVSCNRSDGLGIDYLRECGIEAMILSTEVNSVVKARADKLKLFCLHGQKDKAAALANLLKERGIDPKNVAYVGNDLNDLQCLQMVGLPVVVGDSHPGVMPYAKLYLKNMGGKGAVRELCDIIISRYCKNNQVKDE